MREPATGPAVGSGSRHAVPCGPGIILARKHASAPLRAGRDPKEGCRVSFGDRGCLLALVMAVAPRIGEAEPPADADPALRPWFESLKQPGTGVSCCSISDCRPVQYRLAPEGYEALVGSLWVHVPDDRVLRIKEPGGARGPLPVAGQRDDLLFRAGAGDLKARTASLPAPAAPHYGQVSSIEGRAGICRISDELMLPRGRVRG